MTPTTTSTERALVMVPTYNERESIAEIIRRLFDSAGARVDLLVIDDGSPDGTAEIVKQFQSGSDQIHLLQRDGKLGLGSAYKTGFAWAIERGYWAAVEMDADLSHDPADVVRLLDRLEEADLVIGSRYIPGGGTRNWGLLRRLLSRCGNLYARMWLGFHVQDATAGFRAYRTSYLRSIDLKAVRSEGYAFQVEMTYLTHRARRRIIEVPITFVERETGSSKMSKRIVAEALVQIARWGIARRLGRG